jgi:hypothetical protein
MTDIMAHSILFALDLQFLYFCMVLCKRYRLVNKILLHITKPWKTFRNQQPPNYVLQNILQYRFDQFFDPGQESDLTNLNLDMNSLIWPIFTIWSSESKIEFRNHIHLILIDQVTCGGVSEAKGWVL